MKPLSYICSTLMGVMFIASAFLKAWDAETFADTLLQYGQPWMSIGAPVVIFTEVCLGTALLFRLLPRISGTASIVFLLTVSSVFAYGVVFKGIDDCGCFGALSRLYGGKVWTTFIRNGIFIAMLVPVIAYTDNNGNKGWKYAVMTLLTAAACFVSGLSMRQSYSLPDLDNAKEDNHNETMAALQNHYTFSKDSTYFVYLFSFTCPHCQNSYANVEQYQKLRLVDKVIGLAVENEKAQERFYRIYSPQISIQTISKDEMSRITGHLPIALVIKNNRIFNAEGSFITSPGIFLE